MGLLLSRLCYQALRGIFVGAPLTAFVGSGQQFDPTARDTIEDVLRAIAAIGWRVSSAHVEEKWGKEMLAPAATLMRDLSAIDAADVVLFLLLDAPSPGMNLELGYALAVRKPIFMLGAHSHHMGFLGAGVVEAGLARSVRDAAELASHLDRMDREFRG